MKKRILLVEDMPIFREPIAATLEKHGYRVLLASNGIEALHELESAVAPFDMILLDVAMPDMDGVSFLKKIRLNSKWENIPVIMLTATAQRETVVETKSLGIKEYLLKSNFSLAQLVATIARHMSPSSNDNTP